MQYMTDFDLRDQRVLIRVDFNVPIDGGQVLHDARIRSAIPTIQRALEQHTKLMLVSHLGRPEPGHYDAQYSLLPVARHLSKLLDRPVSLAQHWVDGLSLNTGEIVLCENVRFLSGEVENAEPLAKKMAALCDVFVMDAFGAAHRAHASTVGVAQFAPVACMGPLMRAEIDALSQVMQHPARPLVAIVGGAKTETKLPVLEFLVQHADSIILGGAIANTFMVAAGLPIGDSLFQSEFIGEAAELLHQAKLRDVKMPLPTDVVVATDLSKESKAVVKNINEMTADEKIFDIGPQTASHYAQLITAAKTIIWNGPIGVFEYPQFAGGTEVIAQAIANSSAYSVAGGGDTLAAIDQFFIGDKLSYISTGGGAFLEFIEGEKLPSIAVLEKRAKN